MRRERNWINAIRNNEHLSTEMIPAIPIVEICGQTRVLIENHQGIVGYDSNEIRIKARFGCICVCGDQLLLTRMSKCKLVITGKISGVLLKDRGEQ